MPITSNSARHMRRAKITVFELDGPSTEFSVAEDAVIDVIDEAVDDAANELETDVAWVTAKVPKVPQPSIEAVEFSESWSAVTGSELSGRLINHNWGVELLLDANH